MNKLNNNSLFHLLNTPILLLVFNRLDTTKKIFEAIREVKPTRLYIASDGARTLVNGEESAVDAVRNFLLNNVDWECDVKTLFRKNNLGCKAAVSGGIDWFFEHEEMGIILEDDCLPSQSFFYFCSDLLEKYKENQRIFIISGYNKQGTWKNKSNDYFFSNFGGIWGWASWRRAWQHFDAEMTDINKFIAERKFKKLLGEKLGRLRQREIQSIIKRNVDTWAYPWAYARHKNNGLACVPSVSLIENIGFGESATHTKGKDLFSVQRMELDFPLTENVYLAPDQEYDYLFIEGTRFHKKVIRKLKEWVK